MNKYNQLRHSAAVPVDESALNQLESLLWLHKTYPSDTPRALDDLDPSISAFRGSPDAAALLSKVFTFQSSVPSIEQEIHEPNGESFQHVALRFNFVWEYGTQKCS